MENEIEKMEEGVAPEANHEESAPDHVDTPEETMEELKARLAKSEEVAKNQRIRAEKAEKASKGGKTPEPASVAAKKAGDLSSKDVIALMNAKVAEEDIDEVSDYAAFKGITVAEALKTSTIKSTLAERTEQRNTALATNTGAARRGSAKVSDDALLSAASSGKFPESDDEITRLVSAKAKQGRK